MNKHSILFLFLTFIFTSFSATAQEILPIAKVITLRGDVFFEGKKIVKDAIIDKPGLIKTSDKSFVKLVIEKWGNSILVGPRSEMQLDFEAERKYSLKSGACRWITLVKKSSETKQSKGKIFTTQASLGVRGTDFLLTSNPLFGETEIVMFDGSVEFTNVNDEKDHVLLHEKQWGAIGGRFGQKITNVLTLNEEQLKNLSEIVKE